MPLNSRTLAKIIDGSAIPAFVIDREHKITHWNTAIEALTGRKREDAIGQNDHWRSFYGEEHTTLADLIVEGASITEVEKFYHDKYKISALIEGAYEAEDFFPALGDKGKWLHFTASPIKNEDGEIIAAIETLLDISDRKSLEENLRYYLREITRAQEEERKYIARELHDDMAQIMGSLSRRLDNLLRKRHHFGPDEASDLQEIQSLLNQGLQSMNSFIQDMRPSLLDDLGLIPALRSMTNNLERTEGIITSFSLIGEERRFSNEIELPLFRIVQEALSNIRKHSQATEVSVSAEFNGNGIRLTVMDNGKGFKLQESMDNLPRNGKLGLMGMHERVWLLGGTINFDSQPGIGTSIEVTVPV